MAAGGIASGVLAAVGSLSKRAEQLRNKHKVMGVAVALISDGNVVDTYALGLKDAEKGAGVEADTVFQAASLSKPAFAYCVFQLVQEGKLRLDEPLLPYVTERFSEDPAVAKVTARMVLAHTSGLPHSVPDGKKVEIQFEPGSKFAYSATGFDLLQRAVAKISEQPIEIFMRERMFKPLEMDRSEFDWSERLAGSLAAGYDAKGKRGETFLDKYRAWSAERRAAVKRVHPEISYPPAAAGLYTTAPDYAKFLRKMIRDKSLEEMCRAQVKVTDQVSWGLGWGLLKEKRRIWVWHWGNWSGLFQHFAAINRATGEGIVVLTNSGNGLAFCRDFVPVALGLSLNPLRRFFE